MGQNPTGLMIKIRLLNMAGKPVTEAYSIPFRHWPQAFLWGQRFFVRKDFVSDLSHTDEKPPDYYEATFAQAFNTQDPIVLEVV